MKKINTKPLKGKWFAYPEDKEIEILIRPFSLFTMGTMPSTDVNEINITDFYNNFAYVTLDWKGILDDDDKPLKCNDDNKRILYDYFQELVGFVIDCAMKAREEILSDKDSKN